MRALAFAAAAVALSGCCNGPLVYADCVASGITVDIVDDVGNPALADTVTWQLDDDQLRYAKCRGEIEEEGAPCGTFWIPFRGPGAYTVQTWAAGVLVGTEVVHADRPDGKGQCCGDVFSETLEVEIPTES